MQSDEFNFFFPLPSFQAMNLLYSLQCQEFSSQKNRRISPLRAWLSAHASSSLEKFQQLEVSGYQKPLVFQAETPMRKFVAYIDPEDKFSVADKLSQVNYARIMLMSSNQLCFCLQASMPITWVEEMILSLESMNKYKFRQSPFSHMGNFSKIWSYRSLICQMWKCGSICIIIHTRTYIYV